MLLLTPIAIQQLHGLGHSENILVMFGASAL